LSGRGERFDAAAAARHSELQAERRLRELVKATYNARDVGPSTMTTLTELLDAWWPMAMANLSPSTVKNETGLIESVIKPKIGTVPLAKLDTAGLDRLYAQIGASGGAKVTPLAAASVRRVHNVMSAALGRAVKWGWLPRNPAVDATPLALGGCLCVSRSRITGPG
jgi:integrase